MRLNVQIDILIRKDMYIHVQRTYSEKMTEIQHYSEL